MCQAAPLLRAAERDGAISPSNQSASTSPLPAPSRRAGDARCKVVLLGTGGGSHPKSTRAGFANAVVVDGEAYVVDCGEGVHTQLWRAGITMSLARMPPASAVVRALFLTHLHSDHVIDVANLFLGLWPSHPVPVYGPGPAGLPIPTYPPGRTPAPLVCPEEPTPGTAGMIRHLLAAYAYNINVRMADEARADLTEHILVNEIGVARDGYRPAIDLGVTASGASAEQAAPPMDPVEIYPTDDRGVRVTAILVQHAPVFPALAYRFDTPGGSVVFSGDTGPCDNVARLAAGADILVHEVIDLDWMEQRISRLPNREAVLSHLGGAHTAPAQAGEIASKAGVGLLVLSHLVPGDDELADEDWESRVRPHFGGPLLCGRDLDELALDS